MASPPQSALSGPVMQQAGAPGTSATAAALNMPNFAATRESMHGRPRKLTPKIQQMLQPGTGNRVGRPPGSTSSASLHQPGGATMASAVGASTQNPFVPGGASYAHAPQKMTVRLGAMSMPGPHGGMTGPMGMLMEGGAAGGGPMDEEEEGADTDDRTYCTCGQKSYGEMVACDNKNCPKEWFHYECVGIICPPKGKWFCPLCAPRPRSSASSSSHPPEENR
ncbi:CRE-ING-3 protein [Aphelenchoides avenae]|nr:CRE-ING-3 protein [Aphelenchus avenae]